MTGGRHPLTAGGPDLLASAIVRSRERTIVLFIALLCLGPATAGTASAAVSKLRLAGAHALDGNAAVLLGDGIAVRGTATPGSVVRVTFTSGGQALHAVDATADTASGGAFRAYYKPTAAGDVVVHVRGAAPRLVHVLTPKANLGDRGANVRFLQLRLQKLRYVVPNSGHFDYATARGIIAFRKVNDLPRTTNATEGVFRAVAAGRGGYRARFPGHGRHVEGDLTHQVLALVNPRGRVFRVYITSSGRPGLRTPVGHHRIYKKQPGTNAEAQVNTSYFKGICGIHGYFVVPTFPHSHCCLRVPIPDSRYIMDWTRIGMYVDVFYRGND